MSIEAIFQEAFGEDITGMDDQTEFTSFAEWDSMGHMLFITRLEDTFSIELSADEIASITTIGGIRKALEEKGKLVA